MPQWAGSCWYYLQHIDPPPMLHAFAIRRSAKHWLPVDLYVGGAEHAVLHLLYSRFWHKVLYDRGHLPCPEPFERLVNQGMILGDADYYVSEETLAANKDLIQSMGLEILRIEQDENVTIALRNPSKEPGKFCPLTDEQISKEKGKTWLKGTQIELSGRAEKMSKARKNVVNPDDVVRDYGADSLRLYEMFMGPLEAVKPWSMKGVEGVYRFLSRVWRLIVDESAETPVLNASVVDAEPDPETLRLLHRTIQESDGRHRSLALQHGDSRDDGVLQPLDWKA